jgi:hypothetical protein
VSGGDHRWFKKSTGKKRLVTRDIIITIIIIIIIIIIKLIYWNRRVLTDKTIHFNRPGISFMNKKTKNTF